MPEYIMHGKSIKALVDRGTIVIASGGGGIPVYNNDAGKLEGLDAVIDKDYSAAKMGRIIRAQELWIITDIDNIYLNFFAILSDSIFEYRGPTYFVGSLKDGSSSFTITCDIKLTTSLSLFISRNLFWRDCWII